MAFNFNEKFSFFSVKPRANEVSVRIPYIRNEIILLKK